MTRNARILLAVTARSADRAPIESLVSAGHRVRVCTELQHLSTEVEAFRPDLVVLDVASPDPELVAALVRRSQGALHPMVLCILEHGALHQCAALDAGADACLNRSVTAEVLEVQVRALLRRAPWLARTVHQVGPLVVDEDAHVVLVDEEPVELTRRQFELLTMLVRHAGTVLSKQVLLERLWGFDAYDENLVEVHLSALRRCLPPPARQLVHTVRGVGYVLREHGAQGSLG